MAKFTKPVFTQAEVAETENGNLSIGYTGYCLNAGKDFNRKPFASKISVSLTKAKEKLDGTAKKRNCHEQINSFGWARFEENRLVFGLKWSCPSGLTKIGESVISKYNQLLGYLLEEAGWKNITVDKEGGYSIPLNNSENIKLLYTLSPSIGFYYKTKSPELSDLQFLEYEVKYKESQYNEGKRR